MSSPLNPAAGVDGVPSLGSDGVGGARAREARSGEGDRDAEIRDSSRLARVEEYRESIDRLVETGLAEDVGPGDRTTEWTVPDDRRATARVIARAPGVICGIQPARLTFTRLDPGLGFDAVVEDGDAIATGDEILRLDGRARGILTGERLALNFLQRLSGIATLTREYVDAVAGTAAHILDTRKTTPGLRALEKHAVVAGGGVNHRFGLHDMVLVKENHVRAAGGIAAAVAAIRARNEEGLAVEVETTNLDEVAEALTAGVDRILLDNMSIETLRAAVAMIRDSGAGTESEASGGVSLANVREIALTGVDWISVGALTHSAPALDLSLLVDE
jgi:nicotinate-nucleotide pyrophosphorylase (carboxylating)